jgi:signal transduction histidine kinase
MLSNPTNVVENIAYSCSLDTLIESTSDLFKTIYGAHTLTFLIPIDYFRRNVCCPLLFADREKTLIVDLKSSPFKSMLHSQSWVTLNQQADNADFALPCFSKNRLQAVLYIKGPSPLFSSNTTELPAILEEIGRMTDHLKPIEWAKTESSKIQNYIEKVTLSESFLSLTRGIAHDLRTPMFNLLSRAEVVEKKPHETEAVLKFAEVIKRNIMRIIHITDELLKYGAPLPKHKAPFSLSQCLRGIINLLQEKLDEKQAQIILELSLDPPYVGDSVRLHQAFYNLISNSVNTLPEKNGSLTISLSKAQFINKVGTPLNGFSISITDNGSGIDATTLAEIFSPSYENLGSDLPLAAGIIDLHSGLLHIDSQSTGTAIIVYLPIYE